MMLASGLGPGMQVLLFFFVGWAAALLLGIIWLIVCRWNPPGWRPGIRRFLALLNLLSVVVFAYMFLRLGNAGDAMFFSCMALLSVVVGGLLWYPTHPRNKA
jgi:hypothetical protein